MPSVDVQLYREQGFVVVPRVLSAAELGELRSEIDRIVRGAHGIQGSNEVYDLEDTHTADSPRVRRIKRPHAHIPFIWDLIRSSRLLDLLRPVLGPNIRLQNTKLNLKSAGFGAAVEWHQDWAFYPYTNDDVLALGVLVDDFTEDNGPLMLIPGSHRGPVLDHRAEGRFCGGFNPVEAGVDVRGAVKVLAPAGSVSIHHARAIHGSAPNRSGSPRALLLYEICAADAWPLAGTYAPFSDLEEHESRMICGQGTLEPRLEKVPVRIPLPKPLDAGSIYTAQKAMARRFFDEAQPSARRRDR